MKANYVDKITELNRLMAEYGYSYREALLEVLYRLYSSVFSDDYLEKEFSSKSDEELFAVYMQW